jgi:hypothetical protein
MYNIIDPDQYNIGYNDIDISDDIYIKYYQIAMYPENDKILTRCIKYKTNTKNYTYDIIEIREYRIDKKKKDELTSILEKIKKVNKRMKILWKYYVTLEELPDIKEIHHEIINY